MSEIVNNLDAAKAVPILLNEIDAIKAQLAKLETEKSNQQPISDDQLTALEQDIAYNVAEIEQLKTSVPEGKFQSFSVAELALAIYQKLDSALKLLIKSLSFTGYVDDSNVQYFLAVGEIQKSNETLREQLQFSQRNLESIKNDLKGMF